MVNGCIFCSLVLFSWSELPDLQAWVKSVSGNKSSYLGGASMGRDEYFGGSGVRGMRPTRGDGCCGKV